MNQQIEKYLDDQAQAIDDDMNEALAICGGDVMKALRITLIANAFLEKKSNISPLKCRRATRGANPPANWQGYKLKVETLAVVVRPRGADLSPECLLAITSTMNA